MYSILKDVGALQNTLYSVVHVLPDVIGGSQRDSSAYLTNQGPGNTANQNYQAALGKVLDNLIAAGDSRIVRLPIPASAVARSPGATQFGDASGYVEELSLLVDKQDLLFHVVGAD